MGDRHRLDRGSHATLWGAIWAAAAFFFASGVVAFILAAASTSTAVPLWPAYLFGVLAVFCLLLALAPLVPLWPYRPLFQLPPAHERNWRFALSPRFRVRTLSSRMLPYVWHASCSAAPPYGQPPKPCVRVDLFPIGGIAAVTEIPKAIVRSCADGQTWGPVDPNIQDEKCFVEFPLDFDSGDYILQTGRYAVEWSRPAPTLVVGSAFEIGADGLLVPERPTKDRLAGPERWLRRLNDGFVNDH